MRISSGTGLEETLANIEAATERLNTAQQTVSSGKALQAPSDNPAGVSQDLTLHAALDNLTQYQSNLNGAVGFVGTTDSALGNVVNELQSARALAVQGGDDSLTSEDRAGLANQVQSIAQALTQLANTTYDSRYIFSGQRT